MNATMERRRTGQRDGVLHGDFTGDDDRPVELEATPPPADNAILDVIAQHYGRTILTESQWGALLGLSFTGLLSNAAANKKISPTTRRHRDVSITGFCPPDVRDWAKKNNIAAPATRVAKILPTITAAEALPIIAPNGDPDLAKRAAEESMTLSSEKASQLLGIDLDVIHSAISAGDIRLADGVSWGSRNRLDHAGLRRWIEAKGIKPLWSPSLAVRIAHERGIAAENERARLEAEALAAGKPVSAVELELLRLDQMRAENERIEADNRVKAWASYRRLIRLDQLEAADREEFSVVCELLAIAPDRVRRDVEILRQVAACKIRQSNVEQKKAEQEAASEALVNLERRHKEELAAAKSRKAKATTLCQDVNSATRELRDLMELRPEIFEES